jgi:hypothetical protein
MPTLKRQQRDAERALRQMELQREREKQAQELAQLRTAVKALQDAAIPAPETQPAKPAGGLVVTHALAPGPRPLDPPPMVGPWDRTLWLFSCEALLPTTSHLPWQLARCIGGCNGEMWTKNPQHDDLCENCLFTAFSDDIDHAAAQKRRIGSINFRVVDPFH